MASGLDNPVTSPPLMSRKRTKDDAEFDITAMIDLVFMMNIFFLVTRVAAGLEDIDLPAARHVVAADREAAVVITIMADRDHRGGKVFIGEDTSGTPLSDPTQQQAEIKKVVEEGARTKGNTVIIRAEKEVPLRDILQVSRAATAVEGTQIKLSVVEKE